VFIDKVCVYWLLPVLVTLQFTIFLKV
jgi:hypothetical protein